MAGTESYSGSSRSMTAYEPGVIRVSIGDHWSAGDKGRSKQPIPGMGRARHRCAIQSFGLAAEAGIPTHFIQEAENCFLVNELQVPTHEPLSGETVGEVLPLEFIWRRYLEGSLWERVKNKQIDPVELGFEKGYQPDEGEILPRLRLECTTKYEPRDRKLSNEEALDLAKLSLAEWDAAWELMSQMAEVTDRYARRKDFYFPDGKGEIGRLWGKRKRRLILADTFGTPDENRVIRLSDGEIHSKDIIRLELKRLGYMDELKAAQDAYPNDPDMWPDYSLLSEEVVKLVSQRYTAFADAYAGPLIRAR